MKLWKSKQLIPAILGIITALGIVTVLLLTRTAVDQGFRHTLAVLSKIPGLHHGHSKVTAGLTETTMLTPFRTESGLTANLKTVISHWPGFDRGIYFASARSTLEPTGQTRQLVTDLFLINPTVRITSWFYVSGNLGSRMQVSGIKFRDRFSPELPRGLSIEGRFNAKVIPWLRLQIPAMTMNDAGLVSRVRGIDTRLSMDQVADLLYTGLSVKIKRMEIEDEQGSLVVEDFNAETSLHALNALVYQKLSRDWRHQLTTTTVPDDPRSGILQQLLPASSGVEHKAKLSFSARVTGSNLHMDLEDLQLDTRISRNGDRVDMAARSSMKHLDITTDGTPRKVGKSEFDLLVHGIGWPGTDHEKVALLLSRDFRLKLNSSLDRGKATLVASVRPGPDVTDTLFGPDPRLLNGKLTINMVGNLMQDVPEEYRAWFRRQRDTFRLDFELQDGQSLLNGRPVPAEQELPLNLSH